MPDNLPDDLSDDLSDDSPPREPAIWRVIDFITSTCPFCAFVRGLLLGSVLTWLLVTHG